MKRNRLAIALALIFPLLPVSSHAVDFWKPFAGTIAPAKGEQILKPAQYNLQTLDQTAIIAFLSGLATDPAKAQQIALPVPGGKTMQFLIWKTPMMEEGLQRRYPGIQTFTATAVGNPGITAKIDYNLNGFHAMVFDRNNTYLIDPYSNIADGYYIVYYRHDYQRPQDQRMVCRVGDETLKDANGLDASRIDGSLPPVALKQHGSMKHRYRLAVSTTGEYAQAVGGSSPTKANVLSAIVTTVNRVNGIFEKEIAATLQLVDNNDTLIFLNSTTDPFNNSSLSNMLGQNQTAIDTRIGTANYDMGHVFSTSSDGGLAFLGCTCTTGKARAGTGSLNPVGDAFDVDYVAHEMGHQLGAEHTFNSCSGTEVEETAYEPGGGSTIMAYAGICGSINNIQQHSDAYFHNISLDQISTFITIGSPNGGGPGCGIAEANSAAPVLPSIQATYTIPYKTPFELEAPQATGIPSDSLTYCWDQHDLGNFEESENQGDTFSFGPSFRSFFPDTSRVRIFPKIDYVLSNTIAYKGERLPAKARVLHFNLSVRSVVNGWGTFNLSDDELTANVINTGTPFKVTGPNTAETVTANTSKTITWDVSQTNVAPISTANVDIFLSVDGGYTFPYTLATAVPNTGSASVQIPDHNTATARIKVKGAGNIFFDISDVNFTINGGTSIADITLDESLAIYPNPATSMLTVKSSNTGKLNLVLYNAVGQKIITATMNREMSIPVSNYARGMYYLQISDGQQGAKTVRRITLK